jgi:hypothetical protein
VVCASTAGKMGNDGELPISPYFSHAFRVADARGRSPGVVVAIATRPRAVVCNPYRIKIGNFFVHHSPKMATEEWFRVLPLAGVNQIASLFR